MPPRKRASAAGQRAKRDKPNQQPAEGREPMDEAAVRAALQEALALQARSILELAVLSGSLTGLSGLPLKATLRKFAAAEVDDTAHLAEKLVSVGGEPALDVPGLEVTGSTEKVLTRLVEHEREGVAALHAVIEHSGQEPRSEALEHLLEHVIMRKQQQVDVLELALRSSTGR